jgi:hypothetical protein
LQLSSPSKICRGILQAVSVTGDDINQSVNAAIGIKAAFVTGELIEKMPK